MPTPFDQLLKNLQAAQGDTGKLALVTFDFTLAHDAPLKAAAEVAAIPHWFDEKTLSALLPEHADQADCLLEQLKALPMVEPYTRGTGEPAWNIHEATRLALRDRLLATDPERFRQLSQRAAAAYGSPDAAAPDFVLTCEHLYHALAGQTVAGDAAMAWVAGNWRGGSRIEPLQTLARLLEELLAANPVPPMLRRGQALSYQAIADARVNHQPAPVTVASLQKAEAIFRALAASDRANAVLQRDLSVSLNNLGELAVDQGDLAGAMRCYTESKGIAERLAASDPANAVLQRDLFVSQVNLGDLAVAQNDLAGALRCFTETKVIAERFAASDPANAAWQRDLWMSNGKLGDLAADLVTAQGDIPAAVRFWTKANEITSRLAASDPANAAWQRDLSVTLNKLGNLAVAQEDLVGAMRSFTESKSIRECLAASDPANAEWQRDLSYSCWLIAAKVFEPQELWAEALELMEQSLTIDERLAATDPTNVMWQKDVQVDRALVAVLRAKVGEAN